MKPLLRNTVDLARRANLSKGYAAVFATVAIWSLPSLFMYYLNRFYDPWAQNFYRYSIACVAIAPLVLWRARRAGQTIDMHAVRLCLLPCLPYDVHQITQVMAFFSLGCGVFTSFLWCFLCFISVLDVLFIL